MSAHLDELHRELRATRARLHRAEAALCQIDGATKAWSEDGVNAESAVTVVAAIVGEWRSSRLVEAAEADLAVVQRYAAGKRVA